MTTPGRPVKGSPSTKQVNIPRGGVNPRKGVSAVMGVKPVAKAATPTPGAFPGFMNHGGPVISAPMVYACFWGQMWQTDATYQHFVGQILQFHEDLLKSNFMNMLCQYGVGTGAGSCTCIGQPTFSSNAPTSLTQNSIHTTIQLLIDQQLLPEPTKPTNNVLMIYLDETIGVEDSANSLVLCEPSDDNAFGFHSFFTTTAGNPFYYAIIPTLADPCLRETCPDDAHCSLHLSQSQLDRITQVASHEFAEMTTDPQLNGWMDMADIDSQTGQSYGENGDICNGQSNAITVGANTWNVQQIYSKFHDKNSKGTTFCVCQSPNPLPNM
jgi:hypothetical protein